MAMGDYRDLAEYPPEPGDAAPVTVLGELARRQGDPTGTRGETAWQASDPRHGVDGVDGVLTRQHAAYREALAALVGAVTAVAERYPAAGAELAAAIDTATRTLQQHAAYDRRREQRDQVLRPYRFTGGPWAGQTADRPRAFSGPDHCMPAHDQIVGGGTWAAADAWPGRNRYAPDGTDGDVVLMTWRLPTGGELADAKTRREIRDEEKRQEFALDAATDGA
jgi:hypothetical protein